MCERTVSISEPNTRDVWANFVLSDKKLGMCEIIISYFRIKKLGMCERTLPLLFLNLGGEMLYVLDQRLKAQVGNFCQSFIHEKIKFNYENFTPHKPFCEPLLCPLSSTLTAQPR